MTTSDDAQSTRSTPSAQPDALREAHTDANAPDNEADDDTLPGLDEPWAGLGLRERKRLRSMRRIQTVALDQFEEHGFDQVTVEHIAAHCEVSPSTIYRYFGTKESIVIWDEYDPLALQAIVAELDEHSPIDAIRKVVYTLLKSAFAADAERIHRRMRLAFTNPAIEAASTLQTYEMAQLISGILATKLGRDADELDIQVFAHAFVGGLLGGLRHWHASDFTTPFDDVIERPLIALERGLDLS